MTTKIKLTVLTIVAVISSPLLVSLAILVWVPTNYPPWLLTREYLIVGGLSTLGAAIFNILIGIIVGALTRWAGFRKSLVVIIVATLTAGLLTTYIMYSLQTVSIWEQRPMSWSY